MITRFMERVFSAVENEENEITDQVAADIESAREVGEVDTDEVNYRSDENGNVLITDKETGEVTIAEKADEGLYDLSPVTEVDESLVGYLHPEGDGVTPGQQVTEVTEDVVDDHLGGMPISEVGATPTTEEMYCEDEREFSVSTTNYVVSKIFSDQEFCERLFSEVIESEETANVGDLKIEKDPEEPNTVIVTSELTGDQAKVSLDDDEMEITELESKNFNEEYEDEEIGDEEEVYEEGEEYENENEDYSPLYVVGVDPINHVIVDSPVYTEEDAHELAQKLSEQGVEAIQIFGTQEESRDYAFQLLGSLGVEEISDIEEPVQAEFSDFGIYLTKYYSNHTLFMDKLFSETVNEEGTSQESVENVIETGEQIENDSEIITPVDAETAIIEDKETGEFTKAVIDGEELSVVAISEEEAENLLSEEKTYSDIQIFTNEAETRFFSENEIFTSYMERLYSEEADQDEIESAIETGEQIENDTEIITPVDAETAIIEDKETGEFTKAVIEDDNIDVVAISEEEADELTEGLAIEENDTEEEDNEGDDKIKVEEEIKIKDEKTFSTLDKFFNEISEPVEEEVSEEEEKPTIEAIEDKALAAIQSIQEATEEATAAIMEAKEAPVETQEEDLKEAQFSDNGSTDSLMTWLSDIK